MPKRHYIIYADESDRRGKFYSNFFGGVLLDASDRQRIDEALTAKKEQLGLRGELKWQRVDQTCFERYSEFLSLYFEFIAAARLKVRIMFTQNIYEATNLEKFHRDNEYFMLYYQFIKHAFGLAHCNPNAMDDVMISIYPDMIPDSPAKRDRFMDYLSKIPKSGLYRRAGIAIPRTEITDVDSSKHVILQGLDVILGAICWRLNDRHKDKPAGSRLRGKRTVAKHSLYKSINHNIRQIYPNFNIGVGTAQHNGPSDRWTQPYRHWRFTPTHHILNNDKGKRIGHKQVKLVDPEDTYVRLPR